MSILGTIMSKVFGHHGEAPPTAPSEPASTGATNTSASDGGSAPPTVPSAPSAETGGASSTSTAPPASGGVDVTQVLDGMESHAGQKLDWRHSIVDLMKALDIDSSLAARKDLAKELGYSGDMNDSASMNVWLHKQVMSKLAANGDKLPPEIKH